MSNLVDNIRLMEFSSYVRPDIVENKSQNWVLNGNGNSFYQYIIDRFNGSATNGAIISAYAQYIYGRGLNAKNKDLNEWLFLVKALKSSDLKKIIADFELFGEASMQVIRTKGGDLSSIKHLPKQYVAPAIANEDGEIEGYWYCKNWKKWRLNTPVYYSAFGTSKDAIEIYVIKPYRAGKDYYADPDYLAGLPYAELEEEIANFYINSIKKGLSAGYMIQIPNGNSYTPEEKNEFEYKINKKLVGSPNAMDFVINFNGGESSIEVTPFPVNEQMHKQWEYLTNESRQQLFTAHKVVSPMLFGVKDASGFGNNADELDTAEGQLMKRTIQPKQDYILEALTEILEAYEISLDLYFMPLTEQVATTSDKSTSLSEEKKKTDLDEFLECGEDEAIDGYELIEVKPVDYDEDIKMATQTGIAFPNAKSKWDTDYYLFRYRYAGSATGQREFCNRVISAKKIYRREDIELMGTKNVNPGFGMHPTPNEPYSIWLYKGGGLLSADYPGGTCKHYWEQLKYRKKDIKIDVKSPISIDEAKTDRASGKAGIAPHEM